MAIITVTDEQARDHLTAKIADAKEQMEFAQKHSLLDLYRKAEFDWHVLFAAREALDYKLKTTEPAKPAR